jgi:hypothetical protein
MDTNQVCIAVHAWDYAVRLCLRTLPTAGPEHEALIACDERPTIANIRAALAIGRGRPWLVLLESALIEIALAAIEDVLHEADHDHRD